MHNKSASEEVISRCIEWAKEYVALVLEKSTTAIMVVLVFRERALRYNELEKLSGVRGGAFLNALNRLEEKGVIRITRHNGTTFIELTESGEITARGLIALVRYIVRQRLESGIYTEEEKKLLEEIDNIMKERVEKLIEEGLIAKKVTPARKEEYIPVERIGHLQRKFKR